MWEKVEDPAVLEVPGRKRSFLGSAALLPVSVIIPTRNAASLLPQHLAAMQSWLDLVQEVLVVDSHSTDGTVELLRKGLRHPRLRFLEHPPGLYQSWNFGINQAKAEACYISTVGETISKEGLRHLCAVLREFECDAVISRPDFVDMEGGVIPAPSWPIDDILQTLRPQRPVVLQGTRLFFFALLNYRNAILGSSASNLYRTRTLQQKPFPLEYGSVGDGAWALEHCFDVRIGVSTHRSSTFCEHPKSYALSEYAVDGLGRKLLGLIERTYRRKIREHPEFRAIAKELEIEDILRLLHERQAAQDQLERARATRWPWVLSPSAWRARLRRNRLVRQLETIKSSGVRVLFPEYCPSAGLGDPALQATRRRDEAAATPVLEKTI